MKQIGPGMVQQMVVNCPDCKGAGTTIAAKDKCTVCDGNMHVDDTKTQEVCVTFSFLNTLLFIDSYQPRSSE